MGTISFLVYHISLPFASMSCLINACPSRTVKQHIAMCAVRVEASIMQCCGHVQSGMNAHVATLSVTCLCAHLVLQQHSCCRRLGVEFKYNSRVVGLAPTPATESSKEPTSWRIDLADGTRIYTDRVVVATGGLSYPQVGTDGSGHRILEHV
jgi:hypothetical protein